MVLVIYAVIFSLSYLCKASATCPSRCICDTSKLEVNCKNLNLTEDDLQTVLSNVPNNTEILDLSQNKIERIASSTNLTVKIDSIKQVYLNANLLKSIPNHVNVLFPNLKVLELRLNRIDEISKDDFKGLEQLDKIDLARNQILRIGENTFQYLQSISQIYLDSNKINELSVDSFKGVSTNLVTIKLNGNAIKTLPLGLFNYFTNPKLKINLPNNEITAIPNGLFTKLKTFANLELYNNSIKTLGDAAFKGTKIGYVNLGANKLVDVPTTILDGFDFTILVLLENDLKCSCQFSEFLITMKRITGAIHGDCASPSNVNGTSLQDLSSKTDKAIKSDLCTACEIRNPCLNEGQCISIGKNETQCRCKDGYQGDNCEQETKKKKTVIIVVIVILIILVIVVAIAIYLVKRRRSRKSSSGDFDQVDKTNEKSNLL